MAHVFIFIAAVEFRMCGNISDHGREVPAGTVGFWYNCTDYVVPDEFMGRVPEKKQAEVVDEQYSMVDIEQQNYAVEVLEQLTAVQSAVGDLRKLGQVGFAVWRRYVGRCLPDGTLW